MDGAEIRARRKALGMSQAKFGERLGLSKEFVGRMETGKAAVGPRTALAASAIKPVALQRKSALKDPMERVIESALIEAGIEFDTDDGGKMQTCLDFYLPAFDVSIEVKRFYSSRTGEQMARALNVIVAQGEVAVRLLAQAIRSGDFVMMLASDEPHGAGAKTRRRP